MAEILSYREHDITISGERHHLLDFANEVYNGNFDTIWNDLAFKILADLDEESQEESQ